MVNVIIELILILQIERKNITLRPNAVPRLTPHLDLVPVHQNGEDWLWNDTTMTRKNG